MLLKNIPLNTTVESIMAAYPQAKNIHLVGGLSVDVIVIDATAALRAATALESITVDGQKLKVYSCFMRFM